VGTRASCTIIYTFTPGAPGSRTATFTLTDDATNPALPHTVTLSGNGTQPAVVMSTNILNFGNQLVGVRSNPQAVTLTNSGTGPLTINSIGITGTNSGDFAQTNNCPVPPATLAATTDCSLTVTFRPTAPGSRSGTITITDDAAGSPHAVTLSGNGTVDFAIGVPIGSSSVVTIAAGGTANYTVAVTPRGGFNQSISLACSGAPSASTCSVSPSSITPDGTNPASVTVTVTTTARSGALPRSGLPSIPPGFGKLVTVSWFLWLLGLLLLGRWTLSSQRRRWLGLAATVLFVTLWAACGGVGGGGSSPPPRPPGTPAGTYTLTVTATSGSLSHSTSLTLTVT